MGLLALMLLQESRRAARTSATGDVILLDDQDRSLWDRDQIEEGSRLVERAMRSGGIGPYTIQAAIAAVHAGAPEAAATDWAEIVGLYDVLLRSDPSPVIELNRAVAVGMAEGPAAALAMVEALAHEPALKAYHLLPSVRGDLLHRLSRFAEAHAAFEAAAALAGNAREREFLKRRAAVAARAAQDHGQS